MRERIVLAHLDAENRLDVEDSLATFSGSHGPHYFIVPWNLRLDGPAATRGYLEDYFAQFPSITTEPLRMLHADDAVIVEFRSHGTHDGDLPGYPANGKPYEVFGCGIFSFEGPDLVGETVYTDAAGLFAQIGDTPA